VSFFLSGAGYSVATMVETVKTLSPRSAVEWCVASIVAAFVFLGMGASVSLSREVESRPPRPLKGRSVPL
jgi:hypothetical protein